MTSNEEIRCSATTTWMSASEQKIEGTEVTDVDLQPQNKDGISIKRQRLGSMEYSKTEVLAETDDWNSLYKYLSNSTVRTNRKLPNCP